MSNPVIEAPEAGPAVTWLEGETLARRASSRRKLKRLALLTAGWAAMFLRVAGYRDVRSLDGGMLAWSRAGLPVETGPPR